MATATKKPLDADAKAAALKDIGEKVKVVDDAKKSVTTAQGALDKVVLSARLGGVKYREIASATGRSVAWVQATLKRLGYEGTRGKKTD